MNEVMIFEGKTIEEAIIKAVEAFGKDKKDLEITVLNEEKKGLFGMEGSSLAKIKASAKHNK
jgi:spoIIIJ-associated protein